MELNNIRIGDYIKQSKQICNMPNLTEFDVSGINKDKEFFEPSKQVGGDTSKYKNVPPNHFACNLIHVGRDRLLPIALNHSDKTKVVSPAYTVFSILPNSPILKDYFMIMLKSQERDRCFWFQADSSVRDGMTWEDFCNLNIVVPSICIQQKYVDIYNAMVANQKAYENGLEDLRLWLDSLLNNYKKTAKREKLSCLLTEVDQRNFDGRVNDLKGINILKQFMNSVASTTGVDFKKYKIVKNNQLAFSGMQTGRDECIRIALSKNQEPIIISPAYTVFNVNTEEVAPEYIMMWFSRKETDRYGWFLSDSSIRSNLDLDRFLDIEIPVPSTKEQSSLVSIYSAYSLRRQLNEQLKEQIKNICPILIKGSIEEARKA